MIARIPQILASLVAVALTAFGAWTNCRAAIESTPEAVYWAASGAILVAISLSMTAGALAHGLRSRNFTLVLSSLLGAVLFGWLALQSALDVVGNARMNVASNVGDTVAAKAKAETAYARASKRLDALAQARPANEVEAEIGSALGQHKGLTEELCIGWVANDLRRNTCARVLTLRGEHSRAVERERLTADMTEATDVLSKLSGQRSVGNASTTLIAEFTGKDAHVIDRLVILMRALGIEFGGSFLSMVAVALGSVRTHAGKPVDMALSKREQDCPRTLSWTANEPMPEVSTTPLVDSTVSTAQSPVPSGVDDDMPITLQPVHYSPVDNVVCMRSRGLDRGRVRQLILDAVAASGGQLHGSSREIADRLGCGKSTVANVLKELTDTGKLVRDGGVLRAA
jgi:hypothetical protein